MLVSMKKLSKCQNVEKSKGLEAILRLAAVRTVMFLPFICAFDYP